MVERQVSHEGEVVVSGLHWCSLPWIATGSKTVLNVGTFSSLVLPSES